MEWWIARLAYDERTRAPVEVHEARPFFRVWLDHVALDALDDVRALYLPAE